MSRVHSVIPRDSQRISFQAVFNLKNSSICSASVEKFGTPSIPSIQSGQVWHFPLSDFSKYFSYLIFPYDFPISTVNLQDIYRISTGALVRCLDFFGAPAARLRLADLRWRWPHHGCRPWIGRRRPNDLGGATHPSWIGRSGRWMDGWMIHGWMDGWIIPWKLSFINL